MVCEWKAYIDNSVTYLVKISNSSKNQWQLTEINQENSVRHHVIIEQRNITFTTSGSEAATIPHLSNIADVSNHNTLLQKLTKRLVEKT